jgi:hypothetical protein
MRGSDQAPTAEQLLAVCGVEGVVSQHDCFMRPSC